MSQNTNNQNQGNSPQAKGAQQTHGKPNAGSVRDADKEKRIRTEEHNPGDARTVKEHGGAPGDKETSDPTKFKDEQPISEPDRETK